MGKGGMRFGAGRPGWHVKAEHCRKIDARRWAREGLLREGVRGVWAWSDPDTGERLASIGYAAIPGAVTLSYNLNDEPTCQHVPILATACAYGGQRYWFGCPRCGCRVAVLYLRNRGFGCRKCCRIAYASQGEDAIGRAWRKQAKVEQRLGGNWQRPKGMHRTTYDRLLSVLIDCEERRDSALIAFAQRLGFCL